MACQKSRSHNRKDSKMFSKDKEEMLQLIFEECDPGKTGFVTIEELKNMFQRRGILLYHLDARKIMDLCDLDGDKKLNYKEFLFMWHLTEIDKKPR